jgi:phosphoserine aminotransferase
MLPLEVLERAQSELADWQGSGMSVMEVSHRGKAFIACAEAAEQGLRDLLRIPDGYSVLFLQGGASAQFAALPMNLTKVGDKAAYIKTGSWSGKAISAARAQDVDVVVIADESASGYTTTPPAGAIAMPDAATYLHYTPNETIGGVEFGYTPDSGGGAAGGGHVLHHLVQANRRV